MLPSVNESLPTFEDILETHQGKVTDKWSGYGRIYTTALADLRKRPASLLEVGVQNGGSLEVWGRFLHPDSIIVGCDINSACGTLTFSSENIKVVVGDVTDPATTRALLEVSTVWDVIVDDGSHRSDEVVAAFRVLFPRLRPGGVYVIEDLHASYWPEYGGGFRRGGTSIEFLKELVDLVNLDHWNSGRMVGHPDAQPSTDSVQVGHYEVSSIAFHDSLCVVTKKGPSDAGLGMRVVRGSDALICPEVLDLDGTELATVQNEHSSMAQSGAPKGLVRSREEAGHCADMPCPACQSTRRDLDLVLSSRIWRATKWWRHLRAARRAQRP